MQACAVCGFATEQEIRFCPRDGSALGPVDGAPTLGAHCPVCGASYEKPNRFCNRCGSILVGRNEAAGALASTCPVCGGKFKGPIRFCPRDGAALRVAAGGPRRPAG